MNTTTGCELLWPATNGGNGYTVPAVYAERVGESRYIGRCKVSGCKHRVAVDAVTFLPPEGLWGSARRYPVVVVPTGDAGRPWVSLNFNFSTWAPSERELHVRAVFERLGLFCPEHGRTVKLRGVRGRIAQSIKCTSRCHNATCDTCDCECGGKSHGKNWQIH